MMRMGKIMDEKIHLLKSGFIQAPLSSVFRSGARASSIPPQERAQSVIPVKRESDSGLSNSSSSIRFVILERGYKEALTVWDNVLEERVYTK